MKALDRLALSATAHCLAGCSVGEIAGMLLGRAMGWTNAPTIALAVVLAFLFGYAFAVVPLVRAGLPLRRALALALAADSISIAVMEVVDNAVMLAIPGAMDAPPQAPRFWVSLLFSLLVAGAAAFPVNRWLIGRGWGHAVVHGPHGSHDHSR